MNRNSDLSDVGRLAVALNAIAGLHESRSLVRARAAGERVTEKFEERVGRAVPAPSNAVEALVAQEIRAHVAKQRSKSEFILQHIEDDRAVGAVLSAPTFLSGLTEVEDNTIQHKIQTTMAPEAATHLDLATKALEHAEQGQREASAFDPILFGLRAVQQLIRTIMEDFAKLRDTLGDPGAAWERAQRGADAAFEQHPQGTWGFIRDWLGIGRGASPTEGVMIPSPIDAARMFVGALKLPALEGDTSGMVPAMVGAPHPEGVVVDWLRQIQGGLKQINSGISSFKPGDTHFHRHVARLPARHGGAVSGAAAHGRGGGGAVLRVPQLRVPAWAVDGTGSAVATFDR